MATLVERLEACQDVNLDVVIKFEASRRSLWS